MAKDKEAKASKENDSMSMKGTSAVYKAAKLSSAIKEELKKDGVKEALMDYIFGGETDAVSPLAEIRKAHK